MKDLFVFYPSRRLGLIFHLTVISLLVVGSSWSLWQAAKAEIGFMFLLYLAPILLTVIITPILVYRAYALQTSYYILEREGIRLRWGLRQEDIPMDEVLWVHSAADLTVPLPLPWLRWPGSIVGERHLQGMGEVEFMASSTRNLVLIGTESGAFAISPADPEAFLSAFQHLTEMGSLAPLPKRSVRSTIIIRQVWSSRSARVLLLLAILFNLVLLVWVSLAIPSRSQVHMGFDQNSAPGDLVPAVRLLLLPVISSFFVLSDVFLGLFFFRRQESRPAAFLLWGSGALTPVLFILAVFFILQAG